MLMRLTPLVVPFVTFVAACGRRTTSLQQLLQRGDTLCLNHFATAPDRKHQRSIEYRQVRLHESAGLAFTQEYPSDADRKSVV